MNDDVAKRGAVKSVVRSRSLKIDPKSSDESDGFKSAVFGALGGANASGSGGTHRGTPSTAQQRSRKSRRSGPKQSEPTEGAASRALREIEQSYKSSKLSKSSSPHRSRGFPDDVDDVKVGLQTCLRKRELFYRPDAHYMDLQPNLNRRMRAILFDWMLEVCQEYILKRETLHTALINVDRYLSRAARIERGDLQLVGVASLFLAAKLEEIYPPRGSDFVLTTDGAYTVNQIYQMEAKMLSAFDWYSTPVTPVAWMNVYFREIFEIASARSLKLSKSLRISAPGVLAGVPVGSIVGAAAFAPEPYVKVMEKIDLLVLDLSVLGFLPSHLVASILYAFLPKICPIVKPEDVVKVSGYTVAELHKCMLWSKQFLQGFGPSPSPNSRQNLYSEDIPRVDFYTMQQHHPTALQHYKDSYDLASKLKCQLTIHHFKVVNSYVYEVRLDAALGVLFGAHAKPFSSDPTNAPLEFQFFPSPDLTTQALECDMTTEQLIGSLFPNAKGEYEIYCISTEDLRAMKATGTTPTSNRPQKSNGRNPTSDGNFDDSLRSNEMLNIVQS